MEEEGQEDRPTSRETGQLTSPINAEKDILVRARTKHILYSVYSGVLSVHSGVLSVSFFILSLLCLYPSSLPTSLTLPLPLRPFLSPFLLSPFLLSPFFLSPFFLSPFLLSLSSSSLPTSLYCIYKCFALSPSDTYTTSIMVLIQTMWPPWKSHGWIMSLP